MRNTRASSLIAMAALAIAGSGIYQQSMPSASKTASRRKPPVKRMVTSASDEIKQWNAAVDARKAAKRGEA